MGGGPGRSAEEAGVLYLYGFVPPRSPSPPGDLPGVAERPVELVDVGFCRAAVTRLPAGAYASATVESRLQDLEWVARHGLAHERVVTWFVDEAWILPARLLTLYSSAGSLREEAASRRAEIADALEEMEGLYEWDLKISYDAARLQEHLGELSDEIAALEDEIAGTSPGRGYLLGRVKEEKARDRAGRAARRVAEGTLDALREHSVDAVVLELTGESDDLPVVLGAALLARPEAEDRLRREIRDRSGKYRGKGIEIAFSGPWAPYRFLEARSGSGVRETSGDGASADG